jgi:hypothetical protein
MSVSSVSSGSASSVWWEEYIEKQKKLQQQTLQQQQVTSEAILSRAANVPAIDPEELLAELQSLQEDPEKLKARAAEMAEQVANEAQNASGPSAKMLKELSSDLTAIASDGDLSAMEEKIAQGASGSKPAGMKFGGPSGLSGGAGASMKRIEALVEEDDDEDDDDELSVAEALEEYLEELLEEQLEEQAERSDEAADLKNASAQDVAAKLKTQLTNRLIENYARQQAQYSALDLTA